MKRVLIRGLVWSLFSIAFIGCDLIEDATSFNVCTDWETIDIDTAQLNIDTSSATIPDVTCQDQSVCDQANSQFSCSGSGYSCNIVCGSSAKCEVQASVDLPPQTVDLSSKIDSSLKAAAISKVSVDSLEYKVSANSLNFDTPIISVYVGPSSANTVTDSGVSLFATVPSIAKGTTPEGKLSPDPSGQSALTNFVKDYKNPFKIFSQAKLVFSAGESLPSGALKTEVRSCFKISPL